LRLGDQMSPGRFLIFDGLVEARCADDRVEIARARRPNPCIIVEFLRFMRCLARK
jgi:hypothetical protein